MTHTLSRAHADNSYTPTSTLPFRFPPRSFFFGFGGSAHVHYFGPRVGERGGAGLLCGLSVVSGGVRPVVGARPSAFPSGLLVLGPFVPRVLLLSLVALSGVVFVYDYVL